jgi:hypothetical protein
MGAGVRACDGATPEDQEHEHIHITHGSEMCPLAELWRLSDQ